jgi:hypothetical protein
MLFFAVDLRGFKLNGPERRNQPVHKAKDRLLFGGTVPQGLTESSGTLGVIKLNKKVFTKVPLEIWVGRAES